MNFTEKKLKKIRKEIAKAYQIPENRMFGYSKKILKKKNLKNNKEIKNA